MESIDPTDRRNFSFVLITIMAIISLLKVAQLFDPLLPGGDIPSNPLQFPARERLGRERDLPTRQMRAFENFLDSLRSDSAGRRAMEELLKKEPGLADSLREMENKFR